MLLSDYSVLLFAYHVFLSTLSTFINLLSTFINFYQLLLSTLINLLSTFLSIYYEGGSQESQAGSQEKTCCKETVGYTASSSKAVYTELNGVHSGVQEFRCSGVQVFRSSGVQKKKHTDCCSPVSLKFGQSSVPKSELGGGVAWVAALDRGCGLV